MTEVRRKAYVRVSVVQDMFECEEADAKCCLLTESDR